MWVLNVCSLCVVQYCQAGPTLLHSELSLDTIGHAARLSVSLLFGSSVPKLATVLVNCIMLLKVTEQLHVIWVKHDEARFALGFLLPRLYRYSTALIDLGSTFVRTSLSDGLSSDNSQDRGRLAPVVPTTV